MPHIDAEQRNAMLEKIKSVQNQPGKGVDFSLSRSLFRSTKNDSHQAPSETYLKWIQASFLNLNEIPVL